MIRVILPTIVLEAYCLYDAYNRQVDQKWIMIILFVPFLGSLAYLIARASGSLEDSDMVHQTRISPAVHQKIERLESELALADTVRNRMALADGYYDIGAFAKAKSMYESCLSGATHDDVSLLIKLIDVSFEAGEYRLAVKYGQKINGRPMFDKAVEKTAYAWSLYKLGQFDEAEDVFKEMDSRFSNYVQRFEFAKFYTVTERPRAAKEVLGVMMEELDSMHQQEQKLKKDIIKQVEAFYKQL